MASTPQNPPSLPADISGQSNGELEATAKAVFTLLQPITILVDGQEVEIAGLDMRGLAPGDLPLLDRYCGQPIALAHNVIAALCELTIDQAEQLCLEDFSMLAAEALFQVERISIGMGLPADFFVQPRPEKVTN